MATIKFTIERMHEVYNRLEDMENQLSQALKSDQESLDNIASSIQSENMATILKGYAEANVSKGEETVKLLQELGTYLEGKIQSYSATDEAGQEAINAAQNILNNIQ